MSLTSSQRLLTPWRRQNLRSVLQQGVGISPLLMATGVFMFVTLIGTLFGLLIDHRVITGAPAWEKPAKFAISMTVYSFTLLWFLTFVNGHKRLVGMIASVTALGLLIEMVIIAGQVVRGTTSHFNLTTPFDATLYQIMGVSIIIVWIMGFVAAMLLLIQRMSDPILAWSLRLGLLLALVGMAVGMVMSQPITLVLDVLHTGEPLKIIGAHSIGVPDGGPGLLFLGWSTVGGDLRIPHFVGLHALQVVPFVGWLLSRRRLAGLGVGHRVALVWTFGLSYLSLIMLLIWQAFRAQSIIAPDALTLQALTAILSITAVFTLAIVVHAHGRHLHAKRA